MGQLRVTFFSIQEKSAKQKISKLNFDCVRWNALSLAYKWLYLKKVALHMGKNEAVKYGNVLGLLKTHQRSLIMFHEARLIMMP